MKWSPPPSTGLERARLKQFIAYVSAHARALLFFLFSRMSGCESTRPTFHLVGAKTLRTSKSVPFGRHEARLGDSFFLIEVSALYHRFVRREDLTARAACLVTAADMTLLFPLRSFTAALCTRTFVRTFVVAQVTQTVCLKRRCCCGVNIFFYVLKLKLICVPAH